MHEMRYEVGNFVNDLVGKYMRDFIEEYAKYYFFPPKNVV